MLALSRKLVLADTSVKNGTWKPPQFFGTELRNKTLGIIGLGNIGCETARLAIAFCMRVIAYDPQIPPQKGKSMGVTLTDLRTVLTESDYVSLHLPLSKETRGLLGEKELRLMKKTAFIVNCARGGIIDEKALHNVLTKREIAGAALDVLDEEPPKDSPLLRLENVIFTPHVAGNTEEALERMAIGIAKNVIAVLRGGLPECESVVNKSVLPNLHL
jgi:D-3-phosphoglycerate dehydrogenase